MANCDKEIVGIKEIALYVNSSIMFNFPDISNESEVDLTANTSGSLIISNTNQYPKWERELNYSGNYKQNYNDIFTFFMHGIENDTPEIIKALRNNRKGYIAAITTTGGKAYVFPSPVFLNSENIKQIDSHSWEISLSYRVLSSEDKLTLLSTTLV